VKFALRLRFLRRQLKQARQNELLPLQGD